MKRLVPTLSLAIAAALAAPAHAAPHDAQPRTHPQAPPPRLHAPGVVRGPLHLDQRYRHDLYYPAPGFTVATLPVGSVSIGWRDGNWFFHGGVWFRPVGARYVVAAPPSGIGVPFLPPAVVSLWIGGVPYYYANGVYYATAPEGYVVVPPPPGAEAAQGVLMPPTFIVYPRNGQSAAQADADRAACNQWAGAQMGAVADQDVFQRAFEACMDGRGYSVR
ncbi:DUF6515 family protein [Ramlibacter sp. MMS24-I3-19]|uniref:DUF6515 family protein n=1 Tax=Ramlibacter sp. MMS24-I3-19 TaxID=3416606 RepID=UPI003D04768A